jgi:hypothetical protein
MSHALLAAQFTSVRVGMTESHMRDATVMYGLNIRQVLPDVSLLRTFVHRDRDYPSCPALHMRLSGACSSHQSGTVLIIMHASLSGEKATTVDQ